MTARRRADTAPSERERAVAEHCLRHGYPAALARSRPTSASDGDDLDGRDRLQEALRLQVALHEIPIGGLAGLVPEVWAEDEVQRFDRRVLGPECEWLDHQLHCLTPGDRVLCHGSFHPMVLVAATGGDPASTMARPRTAVTGWHRAVLAEAELDVAFTLLAFWSGHLLADTQEKATMLRMIREPLATCYRRSYARSRPLDVHRLRFWQAFHSLRTVALAQGAYLTDADPLGDDDPASAGSALLAHALRKHFWRLAHGA